MTQITKQEIECLYWTLQGRTEREINAIVNASGHTAAEMLRSVTRKLGASDKYVAARKALRLGLFPDDFIANKFALELLDISAWKYLELTASQCNDLQFTQLHTWSTGPAKCHRDAPSYIGGFSIWASSFCGCEVGIQWRWGALNGNVFVEDFFDVDANFAIELPPGGALCRRQTRPFLLAKLISSLPWRGAVLQAVDKSPSVI